MGEALRRGLRSRGAEHGPWELGKGLGWISWTGPAQTPAGTRLCPVGAELFGQASVLPEAFLSLAAMTHFTLDQEQPLCEGAPAGGRQPPQGRDRVLGPSGCSGTVG